MLRIAAQPTFRHEVKVQVPIDGGFREESLQATFRVLPDSEKAAFDFRRDDGRGITDFLRAALARVDDLEDDAGKPLAWSDELRERLIEVPYVRIALVAAYFTAVGGAARGN